MDGIGGIALAIGLIVGVIAITKAVWQWILGTNILIEHTKEQSKLLKKISENIEIIAKKKE